MKKRVVITGMEIVSAIGNGLDKFWQAAVNGQCGIRRIKSYDPSVYTTQIAGEVDRLCWDTIPGLSSHRRYPKVAQYALYCAHNAIAHAQLQPLELINAGTFI